MVVLAFSRSTLSRSPVRPQEAKDSNSSAPDDQRHVARALLAHEVDHYDSKTE